MRKLIIVLLLLVSIGCYAEKKDSISLKNDTISMLRDSIKVLNQRTITENQFIKLYKYESLYKYYRIVIHNPSQKKYFWGWSKRVFKTK